MRRAELPDSVLQRRAVVYVRQLTPVQALENLESQHRQYALAALATEYGFREVVTIDQDLGRSASGLVARPGFDALVAQLCQGVGSGSPPTPSASRSKPSIAILTATHSASPVRRQRRGSSNA